MNTYYLSKLQVKLNYNVFPKFYHNVISQDEVTENLCHKINNK